MREECCFASSKDADYRGLQGNLLQLEVAEEVDASQSQSQRSKTSGEVVVSMPKLHIAPRHPLMRQAFKRSRLGEADAFTMIHLIGLQFSFAEICLT